MRLRLNRYLETARSSLFLVPMLSVAAAVLLGQAGLALDRRLDGSADLPTVLTSTVDSARAVLTTVAAATISFAGVAFSVSLLIIQLGSSQYSPRVVHTLFRDPFNKRVMGMVVGTFTYSLIVLRSVRSPFEDGGDPVIPNLSVAFAVVLGVVAILAVVAFINHSAHSMDISEILQRVSSEAIDDARSDWSSDTKLAAVIARTPAPGSSSAIARFDASGWVQQIDLEAMARCSDAGGTVVLHVAPGRFAVHGTPICTIIPAPIDESDSQDRARAAVGLGNTRTTQQDPSYALRQLADVALKALSPGINDPTTAQDAIFHSTSVLANLLHRSAPPDVIEGPQGRQLQLEQQPTPDELVSLTFDEVRRAARHQPLVCVYLLESLGLLHESLASRGLDDRLPILETQAALVVAGCESSTALLTADVALVQEAFRKRFPPRSA